MLSRSLILLGVVLAAPLIHADPYVTQSNAIRDNDGNGTADELASYASNYVYNENSVVAPSSHQESRAYAEFTMPASFAPFNTATLTFDAFRYNSLHVVPQVLQVYGYVDDGSISLADWGVSATLLGTTSPIAGYSTFSQRGERIPFSFNITAPFQQAVNAHAGHYAIFFRSPTISTVDGGDLYGFSSLVTVGNFAIRTSNVTPAHVPDATSTLALAAAALLGLAVFARRRRGLA